ncbi:MAG: hypothetical protein SFY66_14130 [Oculatellaceae cyanobacterium bins.114]|nr:hypothetical protein [Oculatellaceae cyanobacterium bins.114]
MLHSQYLPSRLYSRSHTQWGGGESESFSSPASGFEPLPLP